MDPASRTAQLDALGREASVCRACSLGRWRDTFFADVRLVADRLAQLRGGGELRPAS
jgi:hypothetical protein